jgi:hypothetical protein
MGVKNRVLSAYLRAYFVMTGLVVDAEVFMAGFAFVALEVLVFGFDCVAGVFVLADVDFLATGLAWACGAGRAFSSAACLSIEAIFAGSVLIVTPPVAVCANAADALPKHIRRISERFFKVDSHVVR